MNKLSRALYIAVVGCCALGASTTPASAYLDPGSGSLVIQLLLGGLARVAILLKHYWRRLATMFRPATEVSNSPADSTAATKSDLGER